MALRAPRTAAFSRFQAAEAGSPLEAEVAAEKAAALGRAGRALEEALDQLRAAEDEEDREALLLAAAEKTQGYFLQRELVGLRDHRDIVRSYDIPRAVLVRIGVRRRRAG